MIGSVWIWYAVPIAALMFLLLFLALFYESGTVDRDVYTVERRKQTLDGLHNVVTGKGISVARFGAGDYRSISAILRGFSTGRLDAVDDKQELLEELVESLVVMYKADNRLFDDNRFRMDALGYIREREPDIE